MKHFFQELSDMRLFSSYKFLTNQDTEIQNLFQTFFKITWLTPRVLVKAYPYPPLYTSPSSPILFLKKEIELKGSKTKKTKNKKSKKVLKFPWSRSRSHIQKQTRWRSRILNNSWGKRKKSFGAPCQQNERGWGKEFSG